MLGVSEGLRTGRRKFQIIGEKPIRGNGVALAPRNLAKAGIEVIIEAGAGVAAGFPDAEYAARGAKIIADRAEVFASADIITQMLGDSERS